MSMSSLLKYKKEMLDSTVEKLEIKEDEVKLLGFFFFFLLKVNIFILIKKLL
jgi:hypothetical protein